MDDERQKIVEIYINDILGNFYNTKQKIVMMEEEITYTVRTLMKGLKDCHEKYLTMIIRIKGLP